MFNYNATQIFVIQPRQAGGGILSFLLSLDSKTSSLNFKNISIEQKLKDWQQHIDRKSDTAHLYEFCNLGQDLHAANIQSADWCERYVHKQHFYELDFINNNKQQPFLTQVTGKKQSVGIYLTDECIKKIKYIESRNQSRGTPGEIDFYQKWVYSNQKQLLKSFYNIETVHYFSFSDMLDCELLLDHLQYCKDILELDIDLNVSKEIIKQWYNQILKL